MVVSSDVVGHTNVLDVSVYYFSYLHIRVISFRHFLASLFCYITPKNYPVPMIVDCGIVVLLGYWTLLRHFDLGHRQ